MNRELTWEPSNTPLTDTLESIEVGMVVHYSFLFLLEKLKAVPVNSWRKEVVLAALQKNLRDKLDYPAVINSVDKENNIFTGKVFFEYNSKRQIKNFKLTIR